MVSLIIRPNRRIDSELLLEGIKKYNDKEDKPVNIRIIGVKVDNVELKNGPCYYIELYLEIRQANFTCKAYHMQDGTMDMTKTETVKASWETVKMRVKLNKHGTHSINGENIYKFETNHILFDLVNYAFIKGKYVPKGNRQGLQYIRREDLKNALLNLDVKVTVKEEYGQTKLMPVYGG